MLHIIPINWRKPPWLGTSQLTVLLVQQWINTLKHSLHLLMKAEILVTDNTHYNFMKWISICILKWISICIFFFYCATWYGQTCEQYCAINLFWQSILYCAQHHLSVHLKNENLPLALSLFISSHLVYHMNLCSFTTTTNASRNIINSKISNSAKLYCLIALSEMLFFLIYISLEDPGIKLSFALNWCTFKYSEGKKNGYSMGMGQLLFELKDFYSNIQTSCRLFMLWLVLYSFLFYLII